MPIIKSAKKKLKQDKQRTKDNLNYKHAMKDALKDIEEAVKGKKASTVKVVGAAFSRVDKAVKKGLIHKNKASRLKSRVSKLVDSAKDTLKQKTK